MSTPLLQLEQVRCSADHVTLLDYATLSCMGSRVGLSGNTAGIAKLLTGDAKLLSGNMKVLGHPLESAREQRLLGCAVPPKVIPPKWTVRRILELAGEIAGFSRREAIARAAVAADRIGEPAILNSHWAHANALEQALATLALGVLEDSPLLFVQLPLGAFESHAWIRYGAALARAIDGRAFIAQLLRPPVHPEEVAWVGSLDETHYVFDSGATGHTGPLADGKIRYLLRVVGDAEQVAAALVRAGLQPSILHAPADKQLGRSGFLIDVDRGPSAVPDTGPLLDLCLRLSCVVLELLPLAALSASWEDGA